MSCWFEASNILRSHAHDLRARVGLTPEQVEAAKQALSIFSSAALNAIRAEWVAEALELSAEILARNGRELKTPPPGER